MIKFATAIAAILISTVVGAQAQQADEIPELFDHNGSKIIADYREGSLRYLEVRPGLHGMVDQGMAAFTGHIQRRGKVQGTAYVFKKGCDFIPYDVKGKYDPSIPGYVMTGAYPVREKNGCKVTGYSKKGANARLVFVDIVERVSRQEAAKQKAQDSYIEQVYETESDPNWMDGFISSEELEARNRKPRP